MKKILASLMALIMVLVCAPITAHANAQSFINKYFNYFGTPDAPYIHHLKNDAWDEIHMYFDTIDTVQWLAKDYNSLGETAFLQTNGLEDFGVYIQTDYKIDNGDWHSTGEWNFGNADNIPNSGLHAAHILVPTDGLSNKMLSVKLSDAVAYDFTSPDENGDFKGLVSRSGTAPDYNNYHFDVTNHTYTYRYRYFFIISSINDSRMYSSDWSDDVSIGKNATQQNLTKSASLGAINILGGSCLNEGSEAEPFNTFYIDMDIPKSIYNDARYYEIIENAFEPVVYELQYRVNGGAWKEGGVANATWLATTKVFSGTESPLKQGDEVEFRIRVGMGNGNKDTKSPWSNTYKMTAVVTDYNYNEKQNAQPAQPPAQTVLPAINNLNGTPAESQVTKFITGLKNDNDPKGTVFYKFPAKQKKVGKNYITVSWSKVKGAKYYVIYGNKCGAKNRYKFIKKTTSTTFTQKGLKKGTYYKYLVSAFNAKGKHIATSPTMHIVTTGGKYCNFKKVTTNAKKNKVVLAKKGKTFKLGAKAVKENAKAKANVHRVVRYETTNKKIATVDSKGKITAKKKGSCYVYAYAQNGVSAKIKVTVKK